MTNTAILIAVIECAVSSDFKVTCWPLDGLFAGSNVAYLDAYNEEILVCTREAATKRRTISTFRLKNKTLQERRDCPAPYTTSDIEGRLLNKTDHVLEHFDGQFVIVQPGVGARNSVYDFAFRFSLDGGRRRIAIHTGGQEPKSSYPRSILFGTIDCLKDRRLDLFMEIPKDLGDTPLFDSVWSESGQEILVVVSNQKYAVSKTLSYIFDDGKDLMDEDDPTFEVRKYSLDKTLGKGTGGLHTQVLFLYHVYRTPYVKLLNYSNDNKLIGWAYRLPTKGADGKDGKDREGFGIYMWQHGTPEPKSLFEFEALEASKILSCEISPKSDFIALEYHLTDNLDGPRKIKVGQLGTRRFVELKEIVINPGVVAKMAWFDSNNLVVASEDKMYLVTVNPE